LYLFADLNLAMYFGSMIRLRIARNVLCLPLLCSVAYSQRFSSLLGPTVDLSLDYTPIGLVRSSALSEVAVLPQETLSLHCYVATTGGSLVQTRVIPFSAPANQVLSDLGDGHHDHFEFALLAKDGSSVMLLREGTEAEFKEATLPVAIASQRIAYGDVNSDRHKDLLLFGKKRAGISTLLRKKNGSYEEGPIIFPDVSVSDVQCTDLNGDGITDLFALDWVSNQLGLYYGIGHGVFSEQIEVPLPGEPAFLAISPVTSDRTTQIAVSMPEQNLVSMFRCNSTGEIEPTGNLAFPSAPSFLTFAKIDGDNLPELIVTTQKCVYVLAGTSSTLDDAISFGGGEGIVSCMVVDLDGDSKNDVMIVDRSAKRVTAYANANWSGSVQWPSVYGVGSNPRGLSVFDVNGDGLSDIVVANAGSSSMSILLNEGKGRLSGQHVVSVADRPLSVKEVTSSQKDRHTVVLAHANVDKITIVGVNNDLTKSQSFSLPTGSRPFVVVAKEDFSSRHLEILTRYTNLKDGSLSLSLFSQIGGGQFIERSLRASLPGRIAALTIDTFSESGSYELVFVTHDKVMKQSTVSIAFPGQGFEFKTVKPVLSFSDSTSSVRAIVSGYVDDDRHKDVVLILSPPRNSLALLFGRADGSFEDSLEIIRGAQPLNENALILQDVDGDGHRDLTWLDEGKAAVVTAYGDGQRKYGAPVSICPARRVTAIQVSSILQAASQDLILANGTKGSITVLFGAFR
jgi:FG-GAP-like repeat